jgi:hypothetical protein
MDDMLDTGIQSFRNGSYSNAIALLSKIDQDDPGIWMARLYLAMSYERSDRLIEAYGLLKYINLLCSDDYLKKTSRNALSLLDMKMRRRSASPISNKSCDTQRGNREAIA